MAPRVVTVDQEWLRVIHKELHRLVLAVERIERRQRQGYAEDNDSTGGGEAAVGESPLDDVREE